MTSLVPSFASSRAALRELGVLGPADDDAAHYARWVCARALNASIERLPGKSYDLVTAGGERVVVRSCLRSPGSEGSASVVVGGWGFDLAAVVLVDERTFSLQQGLLLPRALVQAAAVRDERGAVLLVDEALLSDPAAQDITALLQTHEEIG